MSRRAVIYIRTSSETQGEKSSPLEQEADCRHLATRSECFSSAGGWKNSSWINCNRCEHDSHSGAGGCVIWFTHPT